MTKKVRILVAGAGLFGREHLRTLAGMNGVELAGVADVDQAAARQAAERFGAPVWGADAEALIERLQPDGLVVATPGQTHLALAGAALAREVPVLVEKPVAMTAADVATLADAEAASAGFVLPGHILRFSAPHRQLVEIVRSGEIGEVLAVISRRYRDDSHAVRYPDIDPVLMTMIHDIDLALWISGAAAAAVHAVRSPAGSHRSDTMMLATDTRGSAWQLSTAWTYPGAAVPVDRREVVGSHGGVELEVETHLRQYGATTRSIDLRSAAPDDALAAELACFVDALRSGARPGVVTLGDAWNGLVAAEAAMASLRSGEVVRPPRVAGLDAIDGKGE